MSLHSHTLLLQLYDGMRKSCMHELQMFQRPWANSTVDPLFNAIGISNYPGITLSL